MFKKVLIAAIAVVVGLAVVKGTWLGSHLRLRACKIGSWVQRQVPPEQEIARLRMELKNLERDDDKHFDRVARLAVQVGKMERDVNELQGKVGKEEARLKKLHEDLGGNVEFVLYEGSRYTKDDLRGEALAFKAAEENLKSKQANLQAKRKLLTLEKKKLSELRTNREQMATDLQRLETALAEERQAQAASESTIDDAGYRKLRKDMESVRERIEVLKQKRQLRGEFRISDTKDEQSRRRDAQADQFLDARFGKVKEVAGK
jgi:septal ring factor EnvC (AmiA/AmiB activator)